MSSNYRKERKKEINLLQRETFERIGSTMGISVILEGWGSSEGEQTTRCELPSEVRAYYHLPSSDGQVYPVGTLGLFFLLES